jgi:hypothetical protein
MSIAGCPAISVAAGARPLVYLLRQALTPAPPDGRGDRGTRVASAGEGARDGGLLVQRMVGGAEMMLGVTRDPTFGGCS